MVVFNRNFFARVAAPLALLTLMAPQFVPAACAHGDEKPTVGQGLVPIAPAENSGDDEPQGLPNPAEKLGKNNFDFTAPDGGIPKDMAQRVGIDQKVDGSVPMGLEFKDETGKKVTLGQYFGKRPVMISMLQLSCDQVCSAQFQVMTASFNDLKFSAGKEFEVLTVSIDPREGPLVAQDVKDERLKEYKRAGAKDGWHFLTGDEKNIKALAASLGIKYMWDGGSKQFIHPDGIVMTTPDGHIARYFMKLDYNPRDLRFSIIESSKERIGTVIDQIALSCFHYNPQTGKYSFQVMSFLRVAGIATVLGGLLGIALMVTMEKKRGRGGKNKRPMPPTSQLKQA